MLPKVLIFTVTYEGKDYCLEKFLKGLNGINYPNYKHVFIDNSHDEKYSEKLKKLGYDVIHVNRADNTREAIAISQNMARKIALEGNYNYLMSLESDIIPPKDVVQRLIRHGKDVITGLYHIGDKSKGQRVPCITLKKWNEQLGAYGTRLLAADEWEDYISNGLKQVEAGGFGCCLIHKSVFSKIKFYYFKELKGHSDIFFFNDCFRRKIPVFVDTDIICEHDNQPWEGIKDR